MKKGSGLGNEGRNDLQRTLDGKGKFLLPVSRRAHLQKLQKRKRWRRSRSRAPTEWGGYNKRTA
jgi:hypothetical protein